MVTTTTDSPVTVPHGVVMTSSKVTTKPQVTKAVLEGQGKKAYDKGKANQLQVQSQQLALLLIHKAI